GLSRPARSYRERDAVPPARCDREDRHRIDVELCDDAAGQRVGPLSGAPGRGVFRGRPHRQGSGRGLRWPEGLGRGDRRTLARADPELLAVQIGVTRICATYPPNQSIDITDRTGCDANHSHLHGLAFADVQISNAAPWSVARVKRGRKLTEWKG